MSIQVHMTQKFLLFKFAGLVIVINGARPEIFHKLIKQNKHFCVIRLKLTET